jgi:hypothetical protein
MDRPVLPDSKDPFELLGVTPPTTALELRRAYVRLSKQFRPERAPEEFKRIRRAYEGALTRLHWSIYEESDDGAPASESPPDSTDGARPERAADSADATDAPDAADAPASDARSAPTEPPRPTVEALLAGQDVAGRVLEELELEQVRELARHPQLGWAVLREQPERWAALELFSLRLQDLLMAGQLDRAVDEIDLPFLARDLLEIPDLHHVLAGVLLAAAWSDTPRVDKLLAAVTDRAGGDEDAWLREKRALASAWHRFNSEQPCPEPLRRFIELFPSVGYAFRRGLVGDLRDALATQRLEVARALDRMHLVDERLLLFVHNITDGLVYGEELAYLDLPEREQQYITHAMEQVAWNLIPRPARRWRRLALSAGVALLAWLALGGYTGLLIATGILVVVGINEGLSGLGHYMAATRECIADAVVETGLPPDRMLEWATRRAATGPEPNNPFGFDAGIAEDLALHTLGRLSRLCLLWMRDARRS